jgi:sugar phosphate isomerase/epimerase
MLRRTFLQGPACFLPAALAQGSKRLDISRFTVCGCSLTNLGFEGALRKILELGYSGIEIATFVEKDSPQGDTYPYAVVDRLSGTDRSRLRALVKQFRHVTTHLPYYPDFRPIVADRAVREKSRGELFRSIDDSGFWGASVATVHVVSEKNVPFAAAKADLVGLYRELGDRAAKHRMRLAIETTRPYTAAEYLALIDAVGRDNVGGTLDTGHMSFFASDLPFPKEERSNPAAIRSYNDLLLKIAKSLGPKLFHLHVHDVRASDWRDHFVPGSGIVDFPRLLKHLDDAGYAGLLAAEILYYDGPQFAGLQHTRRYFEKLLGQL